MDREEIEALISKQFYLKHYGLLQGVAHCAVNLTTLPAAERGEVLLMCFKMVEHVKIKTLVGAESRSNVSTWLSAERYRQGLEQSGKRKAGRMNGRFVGQ